MGGKKEEKKEEKKVLHSRSGRVRKQRKQFVFDEVEEKDLAVPDGIGVPLGEISNVSGRLLSIKMTEPILRKLHLIVYPGQSCKQKVVKKNLRLFKGFPKDGDRADISEKSLQRFMKIGVHDLRLATELLDLDRVGSKEEICTRIVEFLFNPQPSGKEYKFNKRKSAKKKPTKRKSTKKKQKRTGPKRPPSSYFLFADEKRPSVREAHPELSVTEQAKMLGKMWKEISEEEKKKYVDKAAELKEEGKKEEKKEEKKVLHSRSGRVRKQRKQFVLDEVEEKDLAVPDGIGVPLGEISNVSGRLLSIK